MTLFVDASALIAIIAEDDGGAGFAAIIAESIDPIWSPMSCWEAISGLRHSHGYDILIARREVESYAAARPFRLVPVGDRERTTALDAYEQYGKGRHPAKLNMGDCFAYACAKANSARLLYKGDDFIHTDLG